MRNFFDQDMKDTMTVLFNLRAINRKDVNLSFQKYLTF